MSVLVAAGLVPHSYLLTTRGRRTGQVRKNPVLLVEQDVMNALELADRAYVIDHGRVVKSGPAMSLVNDPAIREAYMGLS